MADVLKDLFNGKCDTHIKSIMELDKITELNDKLRDKQREHLLVLKTDEQKDSFLDTLTAQSELEKAVREELFVRSVKFGFNLNKVITE